MNKNEFRLEMGPEWLQLAEIPVVSTNLIFVMILYRIFKLDVGY